MNASWLLAGGFVGLVAAAQSSASGADGVVVLGRRHACPLVLMHAPCRHAAASVQAAARPGSRALGTRCGKKDS